MMYRVSVDYDFCGDDVQLYDLPWPCTEYDFYMAYLPAHLAKFGEEFTF